MKRLSEMNIAKEAMLSTVDATAKGGRPASTNKYGSGGGSITTYVDGMSWGSDASSGSLFGDRWSFAMAIAISASNGNATPGALASGAAQAAQEESKVIITERA